MVRVGAPAIPEAVDDTGNAVITKSTLECGVRVLSEAITSVRSVAVGVWVQTGSRDEAAQEAGISHFVEHMVFKGTKKRRLHQIANRLESVGGYLNAFTAKEHTCYHARTLDTDLGRAIDVTSDLVTRPIFPERELEREKGVVLEEMKMYEDAPEDQIFDRFESVIFPNHAIGRPIIGFPNTVSSFSRQDLVDFVDARYTPNRIVVAVAGNVRHKDVVSHATRGFDGLRAARVASTANVESSYEPGEIVEEKPVQQAHLVVGQRGVSVGSRQRATLDILNTLLGGGMSSRLVQNIREKYGFCYNVFSFVNMHSDCGDFGVYLGADAAKVGKAQKLVFRELDRLAGKPVSSRALARAKSQVKGSIMMSLESMNSRMIRLAKQELFFGRFISLDEATAEYDAVTVHDVQELAQCLFRPECFSRVLFVPKA